MLYHAEVNSGQVNKLFAQATTFEDLNDKRKVVTGKVSKSIADFKELLDRYKNRDYKDFKKVMDTVS